MALGRASCQAVLCRAVRASPEKATVCKNLGVTRAKALGVDTAAILAVFHRIVLICWLFMYSMSLAGYKKPRLGSRQVPAPYFRVQSISRSQASEEKRAWLPNTVLELHFNRSPRLSAASRAARWLVRTPRSSPAGNSTHTGSVSTWRPRMAARAASGAGSADALSRERRQPAKGVFSSTG